MSGDEKPEDRMLTLLDSALAAYRHGRLDDTLLLLQETLATAERMQQQEKERPDAG